MDQHVLFWALNFREKERLILRHVYKPGEFRPVSFGQADVMPRTSIKNNSDSKFRTTLICPSVLL
jgi:hypothetical protein